jgi:hypothetical protein
MTLDTRFALFAVLHESDSGTLRPLRCPPFGRYRGKPDMSRTTQVANDPQQNSRAVTGVVRHDHYNASDPKTLFIGANGPGSLDHLQHQFFPR